MSSIAAVAARIQEKANQLSSERSSLELLQAQLDEALQTIEHETNENINIRKTLLSTLRTQHGMELELLNQRDSIRSLERDIEKIEKVETVELQQQKIKIREEHDRLSETVYAPHQVEIQVYQRAIETRQRKQAEKRKRREDELDRMALNAQMYDEEADSMLREAEELKEEIKRMEEVEKREDEEIAAVAMQIRATLKKKSSLRTALREAKERNEGSDD